MFIPQDYAGLWAAASSGVAPVKQLPQDLGHSLHEQSFTMQLLLPGSAGESMLALMCTSDGG